MNKYLNYIDSKKEMLTGISDKVWEFAELSLQEYKSAELFCGVLEAEGFRVKKNISNIPTAFAASYGSGKPVIGILAEYDALSRLSQKGFSPEREELIKDAAGHGCGHNVLGAGSLAAALAVKEYLKDNPGKGSLIFYGCPGEEGGAAKAFMARDGEFKKLDAAFCWHPDDMNAVRTGSCNCSIQVEYNFSGIASHAAGAPDHGRSALDAVELMNIGVQFLREHMPDSDRVHYAIINSGGVSPNVVQAKASVLYMVRSNNVRRTKKLLARVDKIAEGATLMTDTKLNRRFIDGTSDLVPNFTLEKMLYEVFEKLGVPSYTKEETEFADKIVKSYEHQTKGLPGDDLLKNQELYDFIKAHSDNGEKPLNDFLVPYKSVTSMSCGSTDVGDVSWLVPTAQIGVVTFASQSPGHSWQNVSCSKSSIAHKSLLHAGKVLAAGTIRLLESPGILREASAEFVEKTAAGYDCPIPDDAVPTVM